jgi:hypothetical protein
VSVAGPRLLLGGVGLFLIAGLLGTASAAMAGDGPPQGVGIQAQVTGAPSDDGGLAVTGSGGASGSAQGSGIPGAPSATEVLGSGGPGGTPAPSPSGQSAADGVLAVSGLRVAYRSAGDPRAGLLHVEATVRNASDQVMDVGAQFSATTVFGAQLDRSVPTTVSRLAPGEMRVVEADLSGMGQWGLVVAHLTLRPPARVDGVDVAPMTRDRYVLVPPWFSLALAALLLAGGAAWRWAGRPSAALRTAGAAA